MNSTLGRLVMTPRFQNPAYFLINQAMKRIPSLALQDYVRTETTYDMKTGKRLHQTNSRRSSPTPAGDGLG